MRTRTVREGSAGLLILLGIGMFVGLGIWLRGFNLANRSYRAVVEFEKAEDIQIGTEVRFRGIGVGKVTKIQPGPNGVDVDVALAPADLIIPSDSVAEVNQSGLIGETFIDIVPLKPIAEGAIAAKPLESTCDPDLIVCNNSRLTSRPGVSVQELVRASTRLTNILSDPELIKNVKLATKNTSDAAAGVAKLTNQVTGLTQTFKQELGTLSSTAQTSLTAAGKAANQFEITATQLNSLIAANRSTLTTTLTDLSQTSRQIRRTVSSLAPLISRVEQGELLQNLETLAANAAQASTNLRDVSNALNSPTNILALQQTLDSARVTFQNVQKITSDLDELTGDPLLRNNLRNLINGLSGLVSSTEQLQQQAQLAQLLSPTTATTQITLKPIPKISPQSLSAIAGTDKPAQNPSQPASLVPEVVLSPRLSTSETVNLNQ